MRRAPERTSLLTVTGSQREPVGAPKTVKPAPCILARRGSANGSWSFTVRRARSHGRSRPNCICRPSTSLGKSGEGLDSCFREHDRNAGFHFPKYRIRLELIRHRSCAMHVLIARVDDRVCPRLSLRLR